MYSTTGTATEGGKQMDGFENISPEQWSDISRGFAENSPDHDKLPAQQYAKLVNERIIRETTVPKLDIELINEKPGITQSKIGGMPYLPDNFEIPADKNGRQMKLLAQFNCADLSELEDFPHTGILQFWLTTDFMWDDFKVVYHETIDESVSESSAAERITEYTDGAFPVKGEYSVRFKTGSEPMSRDDERLMALFCQYYTELSGEWITSPEDAGDAAYDEFGAYSEEYSGCGHKLGGYYYICQLPDYLIYRPKEYAEKYNRRWDRYTEGIDMHSDDCTVMLFQLDSEYHNSSDYSVMWGDAGAAHFCISRKDLKNRNFDNVSYYFDCS